MKAFIRDWLLHSAFGTRIVARYSRYIAWRDRRAEARQQAYQRRYAARLTALLKQARRPDAVRVAAIMDQAERDAKRWWLILPVLVLAGCGSSPTAPSPTPNSPPVVSVPPVVTPPVVTPATDDGLARDPRFSLSFYRMFALGANQGSMQPLRRQSQAPFIYLMTVDQAGNVIDAGTQDSVAAALINTTGALTGRFGLEGMARGTNATPERSNQITVVFSAETTSQICGSASVAGRMILLYYKVAGCQCAGVIRPRTVKHELGHALGFWHTGDSHDLMSGLPDARCDQEPSDRERFHALVAYSRPIGSLEP